MARRLVLLCTSAMFLITAVRCAHGQFRQPTQDELKMTADPKAAGAAAVYLNIEEVTNDPKHFRSYYARIKVLSEKGKDLATVEIPYSKESFKITNMSGRTIHPDGTIIPMKVKPSDLMVEKSHEQDIGKKVFTLPSVETGSILEYAYDLTYDEDRLSSPTWEIQRPYFVHSEHFSFKPISSFMPEETPQRGTSTFVTDERGRMAHSLLWSQILPANTAVKTSPIDGYVLDATDVPATPHEEWMPPIQSLLYRVRFFYCYENDALKYWSGEVKLWSKDVNKYAESSNALSAAVNGLISPSDSEVDKAKKLYDAVQALDNASFSRQKTKSEMKQSDLKPAKNADDTWAQKSGTREEIAMLYLAMLRAAGLSAYAVKVVDRDWGSFDAGFPSLSQLDSTLVYLSANGKQILLDPGEKMCPFGTVSWIHSYAQGIAESEQGASVAATPMQQYNDNATSRLADVTLDGHGSIAGQIRITMSGQDALHWRQYALKFDEAQVKEQFDRELNAVVPDGVEAHVDRFLGLNDPYSTLMIVVSLKGSLGTSTSRRIVLPGHFFGTRSHVPFVDQEVRLTPVDMRYGDRITDQVTYRIPEGVSVEGMPQNAHISWPAHALFDVKTASSPGQVMVTETMARAFTFAKPEEYHELRDFYQKIGAAEQEQLVLTAAAVKSPN